MGNWVRGVIPGRRPARRRSGAWVPATPSALRAPTPVPASSWTPARPSSRDRAGGALLGSGRRGAPASYEDPDLPAGVDEPVYNNNNEGPIYNNADLNQDSGGAPIYNNADIDEDSNGAPVYNNADLNQAGGGAPIYNNLDLDQDSSDSDYEQDEPASNAPELQQQLEAAVAGQDPLDGEDPSTRAPLKPAKTHHNRLVARVGKDYEDEKGHQRAGLVKVLTDTAGLLATRWQQLQEAKSLRPDDVDGLEALVKKLPRAVSRELDGQPLDDVLLALTKRHADLYVQLRRQKLPVSPDGTVDQDDPLISERKVGYDETEEVQEQSLVHVDTAGLLRRNSPGNPPVDTTNSVTHFSGNGVEIYVVGIGGDLHMHSQALGLYHHSSLLAGGDVAMAGEMAVSRGKIQWLSDKSGHYAPTMDHLLQFLHRLEKDGVSLDFPLRGFAVAGRPGTTAQQLLHPAPGAEGDAWTSVKTKLVWDGFVHVHGLAAVKAALAEQGWQSVGNHAVVDSEGIAVPERDLRKLLKAHFGERSPARVKRSSHAGDPADLGFTRTVRSADELRPLPAAPDALSHYDLDDEDDDDEDGEDALDSPAAHFLGPRGDLYPESLGDFYPARYPGSGDDLYPARYPGGSDDFYPARYPGSSDESESQELTYMDEGETPSTPHTELLQAYEQRFGKPAVESALRDKGLSLNPFDGIVRNLLDSEITLERLADAMEHELGSLDEEEQSHDAPLGYVEEDGLSAFGLDTGSTFGYGTGSTFGYGTGSTFGYGTGSGDLFYAGVDSAPTTPVTELLQAYEQKVGKDEVEAVLRREYLTLDPFDGTVNDMLGREIPLKELAELLKKHFGPIGGDEPDTDGSGGYASAPVPANAYTQGRNTDD